MRPPWNRIQHLQSSLLRAPYSGLPGLQPLLLAEWPAAQLAGAHDDLYRMLPNAIRQNAELLRQVSGLPARPMLVLDAATLPADLLPVAADPELALALLALSSDVLYDPRRPIIITAARMARRIVLCEPHRYHEVF
jgi:hypothetical protein